MRVRQETAVGDHISVDRQAVLEAKRQDDHAHRRVALVAERLAHSRPQLVDVHVGRVEYQVGLGPDALKLVTLSRDPVDDAAVLLQRVGSPHVIEPAHQRLVAGLKEDDERVRADRIELGDRRLQVRGERPAADVHDGGHPGYFCPGAPGQVQHRHEHGGRQVIGDEPVQILQ